MEKEVIIERINGLIESLRNGIKEDEILGRSSTFMTGEILGLNTAIQIIEQEEMLKNIFEVNGGIKNEQITNNKKQMSI